MKKCKKLLALTMAVLLAFACFALPSFAMSSGSQYGLEATIVTDKESYKANEEIHVTVTVKIRMISRWRMFPLRACSPKRSP